MKIRLVIQLLFVGICLMSFALFYDANKPSELTEEEKQMMDMGSKPNSPYCLQVFYNIEHYADKYGIPKHIAYNIAFLETRYSGPFDTKYHPFHYSSVGASGTMQIMPSTAKMFAHKKISSKTLASDIGLNVELSMKILQYLYERYGDWGVACGFYNTGYPVVNEYAEFCISHKNYNKNWVKP